ncbi:Uncharacterized protein MSYG_3844 [Malassezia sympodialis ATCC 42132]|uniref:Uncharacterized protein n=1 Tax=Malassezia sympodialis (strain ATCC 42132) TaxID=1230383 RepID=A0A1M8AAG5_MALS4|nr:Uncharacterized protein MSYG_3844 [Malassezia sympodialis ATCC 42132]
MSHSAFQQRLRVITFTIPIMVVSSYMLYKRLYLGEEQRPLPPNFFGGKDAVSASPDTGTTNAKLHAM